MNERICLLAEQAKEHANTYDDTGTPIWFQMYNEKFAELFVRECIDVVEDAGGIDKYHYIGAIGKHFGVEE